MNRDRGWNLARIPEWLGDAIAVAVVCFSLLLPGPRPPGPHHPFSFVLPLTALLIAVVLIPMRRRWPLLTLVASVALFLAATLTVGPLIGVGIVAALAAYRVGSHTSRVTTLVAGSCAVLLLVVLSLTVSTFGVVDPQVFQVAAGVAVAAALGDSSRSHHEFAHAVTERAERAEQTREALAQQRVAEERLRIAQDLHDTVAHQIAVISLNAGVAESAITTNAGRARTALATIRSASREVLTDIGDLLRFLRTEQPETGVLGRQHDLSDVPELLRAMSSAGLQVDLVQVGSFDQVSGTRSVVAYRVIQEALTNAHKHGASPIRTANLRLEIHSHQLRITVTNPVHGSNTSSTASSYSGFGLAGLRERVAAIGGSVAIDQNAVAFTLTAQLPLAEGGAR